jgi:hypothetical protein
VEFKTDAQKACYEKIVGFAREVFGEMAMFGQQTPVVGIIQGSALVEARVMPRGTDDAVIVTRSYVVTGAELTPDLLHFLLRANADVLFGGFGVDSDGDIFFDHTILGSTVDKAELRASILAVAGTADAYDDQIVAKWGGQRARDRVQASS